MLIQGCLLEAALGERVGLTDGQREIIGARLPSERGRGCRPAQDNRPYFEGMMWIARTGSQWRHLPDEYGKWNSVFRRYRRRVTTGVFDAMLENALVAAPRARGAFRQGGGGGPRAKAPSAGDHSRRALVVVLGLS